MIKTILLLVSMFIAGIVFTWLRGKIVQQVKDTAKESFNSKKLRAGLFRITDKVSWVKDIVSIFNIRKLMIYVFILGIIFAYGWYQGTQGKPVQFNLNYEKEFHLKLNGHYLHKPKNSHNLVIVDGKGNKIKTIAVKDLPELQRKLKPIGFKLDPIFIAGYGVGGKHSGVEYGAGVSFVKFWKHNIDTFLTNRGVYLGTSYCITDNSGVGIAAGKGFKGDNRGLLYWFWKF